MKAILVTMITLLSMNALAISFITEEDVQQTLGADKVIEVSKYSIEKLVEGTACETILYSKSARAYVVKTGNESTLVVTASGLSTLKACVKL